MMWGNVSLLAIFPICDFLSLDDPALGGLTVCRCVVDGLMFIATIIATATILYNGISA